MVSTDRRPPHIAMMETLPVMMVAVLHVQLKHHIHAMEVHQHQRILVLSVEIELTTNNSVVTMETPIV